MPKNIPAGDHAVAPAEFEIPDSASQKTEKKHKIDPIPVVLS